MDTVAGNGASLARAYVRAGGRTGEWTDARARQIKSARSLTTRFLLCFSYLVRFNKNIWHSRHSCHNTWYSIIAIKLLSQYRQAKRTSHCNRANTAFELRFCLKPVLRLADSIDSFALCLFTFCPFLYDFLISHLSLSVLSRCGSVKVRLNGAHQRYMAI